MNHDRTGWGEGPDGVLIAFHRNPRARAGGSRFISVESVRGETEGRPLGLVIFPDTRQWPECDRDIREGELMRVRLAYSTNAAFALPVRDRRVEMVEHGESIPALLRRRGELLRDLANVDMRLARMFER